MNEQDGVGTAAGAPDGLPMLTVGRHRSPESGSCVMEFVSVLAGEPWSDSPGCTDRALGELARRVNDDVGREARPALAAIAPRLVGALGPDVAVDLVIAAVVRIGLEHAPEDPALTRIQRRVHVRIAAAAGPGGPLRACVLRLARVATGAGLPDAYLHLGRAVSGRPRAERDAARVRALAAAVEDVRAHLGGRAQASSRPAPTSAGAGWSLART